MPEHGPTRGRGNANGMTVLVTLHRRSRSTSLRNSLVARQRPCSSVASPVSRERIRIALHATQAYLGCRQDCDWLDGYYQYANRLAHLQFLRNAGVDAHLVFLYFVGDGDINGPTSPEEWRDAVLKVHRHLGLDPQRSLTGVHAIYVDVGKLRGIRAGGP